MQLSRRSVLTSLMLGTAVARLGLMGKAVQAGRGGVASDDRRCDGSGHR